MSSPAPPAADSLLAAFRRVRAFTERLAAPLSPEDCVVQSMTDASPVKWQLGHTTWFFETFVVERAVPGHEPFHDRYRYLFNSYYNAVGEQYPRPLRGLLTRPSLPEVQAYRRHVDGIVERLLEDGLPDDLRAVVELGLHHEQQHQELILTDVKDLLGRNPLFPVYRDDLARGGVDPSPVTWLAFEGGTVPVGHAGAGFAFDNEGPRHEVRLRPWLLADRPVTTAEYLEFVEDDGYRRPELWLSDGWARMQEEGWRAPYHWHHLDGSWHEFTLGGLRPLDGAAPVSHLSYYEADAYATWAGARLPREEEWEHAARDLPVAGNFVDEDRLHPVAPAPPDGSGVPRAMFGDVWEWTASPYTPYPGFRAAPGAIGEYNGKFMVNQMVLRGGSVATSRDHARTTYRNFFHPHLRWQFSGLRLARDAD